MIVWVGLKSLYSSGLTGVVDLLKRILWARGPRIVVPVVRNLAYTLFVVVSRPAAAEVRLYNSLAESRG